MHLKNLRLKEFRGFTDLTLADVPSSARLVMLVGPNGTGKSSIFDALLTWSGAHGAGWEWDPTFHIKQSTNQLGSLHQVIEKIEFYESLPTTEEGWKRLCYMRSAYRNEADFNQGNLGSVPDPTQRRFMKTIQNDAAVSANYRRLVMQTIKDVWSDGAGKELTLETYANRVRGRVNDSLGRVLPHLRMESLGDPAAETGNFYFTKGVSKGYRFKNLSGGEKAVFDMLIDLITKAQYFDNSLICIDEPESHVNPAIHGALLRELLALTPEKSQLWIATHAIGMLRAARDMATKAPGSVAFINFEADFDQPVVLRPTKMDRAAWQRALTVALDDMASLVAPHLIIACESSKAGAGVGDGYDSEIYNRIFSSEFPEARFLSVGAASDLKGDRYLVVQAVAGLIGGTATLRLVDRDGMSQTEIEEYEKNGYRVLRRRQIESYVFDDEVLTLLCGSVGAGDKVAEVLAAKKNAIEEAVKSGHAADNIKKARGRICEALKKILPLQDPGKSSSTFMRDVLAPLIVPDTKVYQELKLAIFGSIAPG